MVNRLNKRFVLLLMLLVSFQSLAAVQIGNTVVPSTTSKMPSMHEGVHHQASMATDSETSSCLEHCQQQAMSVSMVSDIQTDACQPGHCQMQACASVSVGAGIHQPYATCVQPQEQLNPYPLIIGLSSQIASPLLRPPITLI